MYTRNTLVRWRYNAYTMPRVNMIPASLPKVTVIGFGEFGGFGFWKIFKKRKKAKQALREARAKAMEELRKMEEAVRKYEEELRKKWEQEMETRRISQELEARKEVAIDSKPPIYTWEELQIRGATGSAFIQHV